MSAKPNIEKLLAQVASGGMSQKQLVALYENVQRYPAISDEGRERLEDAIETQMRERFPRSAKAIFGPVDEKARGLLDQVQKRAASQIDLSHNRVLNRVKTGGDMIAGRFRLDLYISYKNRDGKRLSLEIRQEHPLDNPAVRVQLVQVGGDEAGQIYERIYELDSFDDAASDYLQRLPLLVEGR